MTIVLLCATAVVLLQDMLYSMYRVPLQQAATLATVLAKQVLVFLQWFVTPESPAADQLPEEHCKKGPLSSRHNGHHPKPGRGPSSMSPRQRMP